MRKHQSLACAVAVAASLVIASPAAAATNIDTEALRDAVTVPGIREHLAALNQIAIDHPFEGVPTRATGTDGHVASVEYVRNKMLAAGYSVTLQPFQADIFIEQSAAFEQVSPDPTVYPRLDGTDGVWSTADFSGNGDVTAEAVVVDFTEPTTQPSASTSGCEPEDYDGLDVQGKVVLLQRGTCEFGLKATIAASFGAIAAVIFNEGTIGVPDRNDVLLATLAGHDVRIPVIGTDYATGRSLVDLANGTGVTLPRHHQEHCDQQRNRGNPRRTLRSDRGRRRAPRLGVHRARHQRRRLGCVDDAGDRGTDAGTRHQPA
jgi:hypothetical protein